MTKRIISYSSSTIMLFILCTIICVVSNTSTAHAIIKYDSVVNEDVMECEDIKYSGAQSIEAHWDYDKEELRLLGIDSNGKQFVIAQKKPKDPFYGAGVITNSSCEGNTISITIKAPFRVYYQTLGFKWNGKSLIQLKTSSKDYSQELVDSALDKMSKGDFEGARSDLDGVEYSYNYLGCRTIEDFLVAGHNAALSIQKTKGFTQAATMLWNTFELMIELYNVSRRGEPAISTTNPDRWLEIFKHCEIPESKFVGALNDYGFFLQQGGQNDKAVDILLLVVSEDPKRTAAYLNLADAYWELGRRQTAIDNYRLYEKMMLDSKKVDKVSAKVKERLKEEASEMGSDQVK
jgi:tetratricopeptide (TPR) repeat protein